MRMAEMMGAAREMEQPTGARHDPLKGLVAGAVAGLIGTAVMTGLQMAMQSAMQSDDESSDEQDADDPTMKAAASISRGVLRHEPTQSEKQWGGQAVHWAFGTSMGALYGLVAEYSPRSAKAMGVPFGAALFVGADEVAVPAAGWTDPPQKQPASMHLYGLGAHLVYGAVVEGARRAVRRMMD